MALGNSFWLTPLLLVGLYLSRRKLISELARLIRRFGGGHRAFTILWSLIFLPGTIIHEISHFFAAAVSGARTGRIEIFPRLQPDKIATSQTPRNDHVRLGSVQTQELGIIRGFIVGVAPFITGIGLLVWISTSLRLTIYDLRLFDLALLYLFFTIANSLFLSWQDLKLALPLMVTMAILTAGSYFWGIRPSFTAEGRILQTIEHLNQALLTGVAINIAIGLVLLTANWLLINDHTHDHAANTR